MRPCVLDGNSSRVTCVRLQQPYGGGYAHSYKFVQYFCVSKQWYSCQGLGILKVRTDGAACDCTWGLQEHRKRVSLGANSLAAPGIRALISIAAGRFARLAGNCAVSPLSRSCILRPVARFRVYIVT